MFFLRLKKINFKENKKKIENVDMTNKKRGVLDIYIKTGKGQSEATLIVVIIYTLFSRYKNYSCSSHIMLYDIHRFGFKILTPLG